MIVRPSTPAGGAYMAGGAGVGGSGGGIPSAGSVGDGPTPLHRLVDDGLRPGGGGGDNLQLVEIAQRLGSHSVVSRGGSVFRDVFSTNTSRFAFPRRATANERVASRTRRAPQNPLPRM